MKDTKKRETIHITVNEKFKKIVNEIATERGDVSIAEVIRFCVNHYYFGEFRKQQFGYQAGAQVAKGRMKRDALKATLEEEIAAFESMTDDEATAYLHNLEGFYKPGDEEAGTFFIRTNPDNGMRFHTFRYANGSSTTDREDWFAVLKALKEALKEKYK